MFGTVVTGLVSIAILAVIGMTKVGKSFFE